MIPPYCSANVLPVGYRVNSCRSYIIYIVLLAVVDAEKAFIIKLEGTDYEMAMREGGCV
jgi:hypothetical protein